MAVGTGLAGNLEGFLTSYGLLAIFMVPLLKKLGVPVPIPSVLIISAGIRAASGGFNVLALSLAVIAAACIGLIRYYPPVLAQ